VGGICARERTMAGEAVSAHAREAAVCGRACISMAGGAGPVARVAGIRVYCGGVWAMVAGVVCVAAFLAENGESVHTAFVLLMGLNWLVSRAAARRMASDRCDGAIELLLTTELQPEEMLEGQEAAVGRQFRPLQLVLCVLLLGMVGAGFL